VNCQKKNKVGIFKIHAENSKVGQPTWTVEKPKLKFTFRELKIYKVAPVNFRPPPTMVTPRISLQPLTKILSLRFSLLMFFPLKPFNSPSNHQIFIMSQSMSYSRFCNRPTQSLAQNLRQFLIQILIHFRLLCRWEIWTRKWRPKPMW
jgi:hypothetical protein